MVTMPLMGRRNKWYRFHFPQEKLLSDSADTVKRFVEALHSPVSRASA